MILHICQKGQASCPLTWTHTRIYSSGISMAPLWGVCRMDPDRLPSLQEAGRAAQRALRAMAMAAGTAAVAQGRLAQAAALGAWRACPQAPSWAAQLWALGRCSSWHLVCDSARSLAC